MIPSILCYVPQSIELLGLTTRQFFKPRPTTPMFTNHIDAADDKNNNLG